MVAGRRCLRSLAEFERDCLLLIDEEQRKINRDNALIELLCDAVRLKREHQDAWAAQIRGAKNLGRG